MVNVNLKHGWVFIIVAVMGELLVPFLLAPLFYVAMKKVAMKNFA